MDTENILSKGRLGKQVVRMRGFIYVMGPLNLLCGDGCICRILSACGQRAIQCTEWRM